MAIEWTEAKIQEAVRLLAENLPTIEVARRLGTSHSAMIDALRRNGIHLRDIRPLMRSPQRPWTAADDAIFRHEWEIGTPEAAIAQRMKRSYFAILARRNRLGLDLRARGGKRVAAAQVEARAAAPSTRRCLSCRQPFAPAWRTNFICAGCTHSDAFASPVSEYRIGA